MKQVRSKNFFQRQTLLNNTIPRMVKLKLDFETLRGRNWKGTEQPFVGPVREVAEELDAAITHLRNAERKIEELGRLAETRGK